MAIVITKAEIKRKCMIPASETAYDSDIDALIAEMQPGIEYTIADSYLNDTGNSRLQALLKLGILEILSGEFIQQIFRKAGASESFKIGSLTIGARPQHGLKLIEQGQTRLCPFRKAVDDLLDVTQIASTNEDSDRVFTDENMRAW